MWGKKWNGGREINISAQRAPSNPLRPQLARHHNDVRSDLPHFPAPEKPELPRNALDERPSPFSGAGIQKRRTFGNR
jgi:hypothetical protein